MGDLPRWRNDLIVMGDLLGIGEGSKVHSKGGRVRKRITQVVRAQRRTQKEVELENALPRW
jgi:hypothetical protein